MAVEQFEFRHVTARGVERFVTGGVVLCVIAARSQHQGDARSRLLAESESVEEHIAESGTLLDWSRNKAARSCEDSSCRHDHVFSRSRRGG